MQIRYQHSSDTDFIQPGQAERIHETALRILREVGLEVAHEDALRQLANQGFRVSGGRVFFEPKVVEEYLAERRRRREARALRREPSPEPQDDGVLHLSPGVYAHHVHDLDADRIVPYTSEKLIEMTKLVDVLEERNVHSASPGYPMDVPPPLEPVAKYRIGALYSRHGEHAVDPISLESIPYVFEMAEVLGHPIDGLPVYVFSPLRLAGESLDVVMRYRDRLENVFVGAMPALGGTVPVLPFGAMALAAAEVIGGFIVLSAITAIPTDFGIGLHAFDLRYGTMVFGSPESYLFGQLNAEINEFYDSGRRPHRRHRGHATAGIHVRSNFPGAAAAAEKSLVMTTGALVGARWFTGAGILSVDEVFSAEQLLVDCDIRDGVQRLVAGLDMSDGDYDWVKEVRQGVQRGFIAVDSTLDHYREVYWHPKLFDRGFLASQGYEGRLKLAERAREMVRQYVARHEFELEPAKRREVERIYQRAVRELG